MPELQTLTERQWGVYSSDGLLIDAVGSRREARECRVLRERESGMRERFFVAGVEVTYQPLPARRGRG